MIAPDHDRGLDLPALDELVDPLTEQSSLAIAEPAHARRKSLERHATLCQADPTRQRLVLWEELEHEPVGPVDIGHIARERDPAEGPATFREQWTDVFG